MSATKDPSGRRRQVLALRSEIRAAVAAAGASNPRLFGSVARGEDGPDSDIDVLVDLDVHQVGLVPLLHIAWELDVLLPGERFDVVAVAALRAEVLAAALLDAEPL